MKGLDGWSELDRFTAAPSVGALKKMDGKTDDNVGAAYIALSCVADTRYHVRPKCYLSATSWFKCPLFSIVSSSFSVVISKFSIFVLWKGPQLVKMSSRAIPWRPDRDRRRIEWLCVAGIGRIQFFVL
jgi:hypothetical protein